MRIAIFGAESTGKSTLARALATHFNEPWASEFVRTFWDAHDGHIVAADLDAIARGQVAGEETAAGRSKRLVFCDTDLITNTLWADLLFPGQCPPWLREQAELRSRQYALYLLCDTDLPFEPDPQRCFPAPHKREYCRKLWRAALVDRNLPFVDIRGNHDQRLHAAIAAIKTVAAQSRPEPHGS